MKKLVILLVMLSVSFTYAQDKKETKLEKKGDLTIATYYHESGEVAQTGAFDADGKLQGEWTSYDVDGNKVTVGTYEAGKKVGKWFFWEGNSLKEVDYIDSRVVNINKWDNKTKVALRNR
ncbi:nicotinic acid mononucleotide adenyltransferase [Winogradskyella eckloniae]|uniref:toxin-antitoxin system YwqK family antitoxin n=1 Tax=Winogradskyella eckloniae TaxID=1089306 RepID=UPI0015673089|nr:nicotinic acid mononucleotide adenyltransferase [Winogradskyella eckloniae]NRD18894.1 nicotinic acid mononucleotide adenyltransferase [Winogradskyella eckloniae]